MICSIGSVFGVIRIYFGVQWSELIGGTTGTVKPDLVGEATVRPLAHPWEITIGRQRGDVFNP